MKLALKERLPRTRFFQTRLREEPVSSLSIGYSNDQPDPRIDAHALDWRDTCDGCMSIVWHYVISTDGVVEIGRDPLRTTVRTRKVLADRTALHIAIVGGLDPDTGDRAQTTTPEQAEALAELEQALADALQRPLEIWDGRENWTKSREERDPEVDPEMIEEHQTELEADLERHEAQNEAMLAL